MEGMRGLTNMFSWWASEKFPRKKTMRGIGKTWTLPVFLILCPQNVILLLAITTS
jgi:hypothetical protein